MGSNEKGMRHDNSKILGFGLLTLATVLVLRKTKAPGVGSFQNNRKSQEMRTREAKDAFEALRLYYGDKFTYETSGSTSSEYLERKAGNPYIKVRCSNHRHASMDLRKPVNVGIDLFKMTNYAKDAQETYAVAKRIIDNYL